jgi:superfamily II DNA or RNA helicase
MSVSELEQVYDEFQSDAVDAIIRDFTDKPNGRYLLVIPTGGGKTWTAVKAINALYQKGILNSKSDRVLWITHRIELEDQAEDTFSKYAEDKRNLSSYGDCIEYLHDLKKIKSKVLDSKITFVVIDEAHHSKAKSYQAIFQRGNIGVLGLTATPSRHDGQALNFDKESYSIGFPDLIQKRVIIDPKLEPPIKTGHRDEAEDFDGVDKDKLNNDQRNKRIISALKERHKKYNKVVIYVGTEKHVKDLYEQINQSPLKKCYDSINWILGGKGKNNSRRLDRKEFVKQEKLEKKSILINIEVLTEGYDDPTIDTVVMACPMKSTLKYMQAAGRAVRRDKNNDDKEAYIVPVEDDLPNIRYRFNNRWLYSDISDALEPEVIDETYSDECSFKEVFEALYSKPESFVDEGDRIYPPYSKNDRFSVILFKIYVRNRNRYLPVVMNNQNRIQFKGRYNFLSERLSHQKVDYDKNHSWALPKGICDEFGALRSDQNRRHAWDAMKSAGKSISNSPLEEAGLIKEQRPWIKFIALRYKAKEISSDLLEFMDGMENKERLLEDITGKSFEPSSVIIKLPLPLGGFKGMILNPETFSKVNQMINDLEELQTAHGGKDYLEKLNQYFSNSDFPIQLRYQNCITLIVRDSFEYCKNL